MPPIEKVVIQKVEVPATLLTCQAAPKPPAEAAGDKALAGYMVKLSTAGADCRNKLGAVRKLVQTPR